MMRRMSDQREPDPPDLIALAKRFVDLWQEQMTALAGDPELADSIGRFLAGLPVWTGAHDRPGWRPDRTAAAAAASDERGGRLEQFAIRLALVEERLARLEFPLRPGAAALEQA